MQQLNLFHFSKREPSLEILQPAWMRVEGRTVVGSLFVLQRFTLV